eukprot:Nk52_evm52s914 gene=Nk52_evmTU52s914
MKHLNDLDFVNPVSPSLLCPICREVCARPVISLTCHHSYCASCIASAVLASTINLCDADRSSVEAYINSIYGDVTPGVSPVRGGQGTTSAIAVPNVVAQCPLCRTSLTPSDLHPNLALAALTNELNVYCSNRAKGCTSILTIETRNAHERVCPFAPNPCPYNKYGCTFTGTEELIKAHTEKDCKWAAFKEYIKYNEEKMLNLQKMIEAQQEEIEFLKAFIANPDTRQNVGTLADANTGTSAEAQEEHWSVREILCRQTLHGHTRGVTSLAYYGGEEGIIYSGSHDGSIRAWNESTGECFRSVDAHSTTIWGLATDPSSGLLYSGGSDGKIKCWNLNSGREEKVMDICMDDGSVAVEGHGKKEPNGVVEEDVNCPYFVETLANHTGRIYDIMFHDNKLFSASVDRTISIWDPTSRECLHTFRGHTDGVNAICMSGDFLASASSDKTIKLWDLTRGECVHTIEDNSSDVLALCVGPDYLFCATQSADVKVFDRREYRLRHRLSGHRWEVWQLLFTGNSTLFSGSFDHTIRRWDTRTLSSTGTLYGHKGYVHAMAEGRNNLLTGCGDKTIKLWAC